MQNHDKESSGSIDHRIFWPALIAVLGLSVPLCVNPEKGLSAVNVVFSFVTSHFGWLFLLFGMLSFGILVWLAVGRYGNIKLGGPDDEPEFSYPSWIAMMFCAGVGIGLMIWSIVEPIYYLQGPPYGLTPHSNIAAEWAHMYPLFHWGFSAWAIYCLPAVPVAYSVYVRKDPHLRISSACKPVLGRLVDGWLGALIDISVMFGLIGAVGTSLGLAVPLVTRLFSDMFGVQESFRLNLVILAIWTAIFSVSVYKGLSKGIKVLSDINMYLALGIIVFVLLAGPTVFILSIWTNSVGLLLDSFFRMTLWLDPVSKSRFPETWTVFYWAWWIAYVPMMALFVARISKGRTIRELIIAECVWGTMGCWLYLAILGAYSIYLNLNGIVPVSDILTNEGAPAACIAVMSKLPMRGLVIPLYTILCFIFLSTTLDSSAYTLASVCTKELKGDEQPARWNRLFWAVVLAVVSVGLLLVGGLKAVQLSTIIAALPLIPALLILIWSLLKSIRQDFADVIPAEKYTIDYPQREGDSRAEASSPSYENPLLQAESKAG